MPLLFLSLTVALAACCVGYRRLALLFTLTGVLVGLVVFLCRFQLPPGTHL